MTRRVYFDGLNLALRRGTGIASYTRMLARLLCEDGYETGGVFSAQTAPPRDPALRAAAFLAEGETRIRRPKPRRWIEDAADHLRYRFGFRPTPIPATDPRMPPLDHLYVARNLFNNARRYFEWTGRFVEIDFDVRPDILHCTYPMPLAAKRAANIYTIHDLVPLKLPSATLDDSRQIYRLLQQVGRRADHIVTVSENSRRDIIELLGVDEGRVTNTYQAAEFPPAWLEVPDATVAARIEASFGLGWRQYLLFFGAIEPKKNVGRLIDAYLASQVPLPLVLVSSGGWQNEAESRRVTALEAQSGTGGNAVKRIEFVAREVLTQLVRGARAVLFPSLYEGFGLPVLEAMMLGTPVVSSNISSIPEIAGDAGLLVDPYQTDQIAAAIRSIVNDDDLSAELSRRGRERSMLFSTERYRNRIRSLYGSLI